MVRLNKYIAQCGVTSRRGADALIEEGRVTVDGVRAQKGQMVTGNEEILLDSRPIYVEERKVVLACYKERGVVTSSVSQAEGERNIIDEISYKSRIFPIGRLDKDSEGLILLTNDGELVNTLLKGEGGHEKEYEVITDKFLKDEDLKKIAAGGLKLIEDSERLSRPCRITRTGDKSLKIILTEGINRQIRRSLELFGYKVIKLKRIRFLFVTLGRMKPGEVRELDEEKISDLYQLAGLAAKRGEKNNGQD
ncbi:MAG: pseudouridine synthase [Lachnospiraceae bacterium]|nr:pseudouridine synthase [Lachnospiraceae bacterium]